jgi:hypothetical protein
MTAGSRAGATPAAAQARARARARRIHDTALAATPASLSGWLSGAGVAGGKGRPAAKGGRTARAKMAGMMARTIRLATEVVNTAQCW